MKLETASRVNVVNVVNMWKTRSSPLIPMKVKGWVNVVNVVQRFFGCRFICVSLSITNHPITKSLNSLKFPVNSLFLCMGIAKARNPCGFFAGSKKIPC